MPTKHENKKKNDAKSDNKYNHGEKATKTHI
jgi:hypothetical protein